MDEIHSDEENADEAIAKEKQFLRQYTDKEIFFISNEKNSRFYHNISNFRDFLSNQLAADVRATLERAAEKRLHIIAEALYEEISQQHKAYRKLADGQISAYEEEKNKITNAISRLNDQIAKRTARLKEDCANTEREAQSAIEPKLKKAEKQFCDKLSELPADANSEAYETVINDLVLNKYSEIQEWYMENLEKIVAQGRDDLKSLLAAEDLPYKERFRK